MGDVTRRVIDAFTHLALATGLALFAIRSYRDGSDGWAAFFAVLAVGAAVRAELIGHDWRRDRRGA